MIAIVGRRPKQLGLLEILDAYIAHQKDVILKRSRFDLAHAEKRYHIVIGLIKAISILDEVVRTIRASKNKADAIANLVKEYDFTEEQATAIVELQLYRLTNTDVVVLEEEKANLERIMKLLEEILSSPEKLNLVIKEELRRIRREYFMPRLTEIRAEIEEIKIDNTMFIPDEDVIVALSHEGYIKRVSTRSYSKTEEETALKDTDYLIGLYKVNTRNTLLVFTNLGNYLYLPVYELPEAKWKELGKHISNIIPLAQNENIIGSMPVYNFDDDKYITSFTKNGMAKRTKLKDFAVQRYSKPICMMNLKAGDEVVSVDITNKENTFIATHNGYGLWYSTEEIPVIGIRAAGVKSINLKDDYVVSGVLFDDAEYITILTDKGTGKRLKLEELEKTTRAKRGSLLMKEIKSNPSKIISIYIENTKSELVLITEKEHKTIKLTDIKVMDKQSNGSFIAKNKLLSSYIKKDMVEN
jgi:topoisomerase IV subunit A